MIQTPAATANGLTGCFNMNFSFLQKGLRNRASKKDAVQARTY